MEKELTQVGISVEMRDKAKIHAVKYKNKYETMTDFVSKAVESQIEADEHDSNTKPTY